MFERKSLMLWEYIKSDDPRKWIKMGSSLKNSKYIDLLQDDLKADKIKARCFSLFDQFSTDRM